MKIRCEHNSIRLRLRKSELVQLKAEGWLQSTVQFPDGNIFAWEILLKAQTENMIAEFAHGRMRIEVPEGMGHTWMDTDEVSMECFLPLDENGHALHVLVEKDFPCKDRPEEDKSDFFSELAEDAPQNC